MPDQQGCRVEDVCDDHIKLPYFQKTEHGWKWLIKNQIEPSKQCHCGKQATWLLVVADE